MGWVVYESLVWRVGGGEVNKILIYRGSVYMEWGGDWRVVCKGILFVFFWI